MGASQSTTEGIPVTSMTNADVTSGPGEFHVQGLNDTVEDLVNASYQKGKSDAESQFASTMEAVAAQVYENVDMQLRNVQNDSIAHAEQLAAQLKASLLPAVKSDAPCQSERSFVVSCLESNSNSPLACQQVVKLYTQCANNL